MSLTPDQAAQSLAEVESTQQRSRQAIGYSHSSPFLLVVGLFWLACYGATQFWPQHTGLIWGWGCAVFGAAMIGLMLRTRRARLDARGRAINRNIGIMFGIIVPVFAIATVAVMWPVGGLRIGAFVPLLYASIYTGMGLWMGPRYVVVGVAVFIGTLVGYYFLKEYFSLWMAVIGGGSMLLTGLWLRRP